MEAIRLAAVPRVEITATRVLPETGAVPNDTLNEMAVVEAVVLCTRAIAAPVEIACVPMLSPARSALPVKVRLAPSRLLVIDSTAAVVSVVPSYGWVPLSWIGRGVMVALATLGCAESR